MKHLLTAVLLVIVVSVQAQSSMDTAGCHYLTIYYPKWEHSHITKVYDHSYIEQGNNYHVFDVHTNFNIHNNDSLRYVIESIKGVETIDTWSVHKYSFLVIIGEMFDARKVGDTIQQKIEEFIK